jgi:hypothetical protein
MNRELRDSYRIVARIGGMGLCNFCKFASWSGSCCDSELECEHPLLAVSGKENDNDNVWGGGGDCWGFRPNKSLEECGIQASIYHDKNIPHLNRKGEIVAIIPNEDDKVTYNL